ncbi:MAG TPA: N-acyl homoserine lactonase family protein [Gemmatimonadales bacterium]|nr:N-acyl homoserine lactonase family protein [Gemmatimonadales bacterium]
MEAQQAAPVGAGAGLPSVEGVRLHMFEGGSIKCRVHNVKMGQGQGEPFEFPVPWFVIEHPRGLVVIDGGMAPGCAEDPLRHWGPIANTYWPVMQPEQACVPALEAAGFDPGDVRYLLQSHLHLDHSGGLAQIEAFGDVEVVATRTDYEYAHAPDWYAEAVYIDEDFQRPGVRWALLDDNADGYDLFGDGTIRCWQTPGHAPGHQSFEVKLPNSGAFMLTIDAAYTTDHWEERALPGFIASAVDTVRSVRKLHHLARRSDATVVTGHDPDAWPRFRHSPEAYS